MRNRLLSAPLCAFLLLLLGLGQVHAQCPTLFSDGFESGNWTPTWTAGTGTYSARTVVTTAPAQGTYCMMMTGGSGHMNGIYKLIAPATPPTISWWVKTTTIGTPSGYVVVGDANVQTNNGLVFSYFTGNNLRIYAGSLGDFIYPAANNTWYKVELKNVNFNTKTFDIWINNTLMQANFPFRSQSTTAIDRIHLYNFSSTTAYWDDVNIGGVGLNLTAQPSPVLCNGDTTGSAMVNSSGGTLPYTYLWSNGQTTQTATGLAAGSYSVSVTDGLGCTGTVSASVTEPTVIATADTAYNALCFGDSSGSISLGATGGTPGYTYLWSNGATTQNATGLPAGNYMVTVTDNNGCTTVDSATISEPGPLLLSPQVTSPSCNGSSDGSVSMLVTGGTPGYFYTWNTGSTASGISGLAAGTYTCFVADTNGCSDGAIIQVSEPTAILTSSVITSPGCGGDLDGAIDLTATGGAGSYTYAWSNGATSEDLGGIGAGTYLVTVTDQNGCTTIDSLVVTEPPILSHSAVILDDTGPANGSINLTVGGGNPGYTYSWSNGATTEDLNNLAAGSYTVTVTDANGCTLTISFTVNLVIGVSGQQPGPRVVVSPNPNQGWVKLEVSMANAAPLQIRLMDLSGRIVMAQDEASADAYSIRTLDLSHVSAGVYLLQVSSEGQNSYMRIVRE